VFYYAPDELDLFLYFFETGLYVEPDPDKVRELLPFMPPPTTAERRRFRSQQRKYISTRTDPLDAWYQSTLALARTMDDANASDDLAEADLVEHERVAAHAAPASGPIELLDERHVTEPADLVVADQLAEQHSRLVDEPVNRHERLGKRPGATGKGTGGVVQGPPPPKPLLGSPRRR
jgi:hypothetical protein